MVKAGSLAEDDDQRGLAHLVEHLAFVGTTHFPGQAIRDFVERNGMSFGADLNADTSYESTSYRLAVPVDQPSTLATGLDVLRDWASEVSFEPAAIDHERRVVLEERRLRAGDERDAALDYLLHGTRFAARPPIGDPDIVAHAPPAALVRYYHDWYRPDLMTVIVVGDVDPAETEAAIRARFASLASPAAPRALPSADVHIKKGDVAFAVAGRDQAFSAAVFEEEPANGWRTFGDLRRALTEKLRMRALGIDDGEQARRSEWTEQAIWSGTQFTVDHADFDEALLDRVERAHRGALPAAAIARARRELLEDAAHVADAERTTSGVAADLADRAVHGGWFLAPRDRGQYTAALVPAITDTEIAQRDRGPGALFVMHEPWWNRNEARENAYVEKATREDFARVMAVVPGPPAVEVSHVTSGHRRGAGLPPPELPPFGGTPGRVVATRTTATGVIEWTLSNGAHVLVKHVPSDGHSVELVGLAPGGASAAPEADQHVALTSALLVRLGGADLPPDGLERALSAARVSLSLQMAPGYARVDASARLAEHLDAMFRALDLTFRTTHLGDKPQDALDGCARTPRRGSSTRSTGSPARWRTT